MRAALLAPILPRVPKKGESKDDSSHFDETLSIWKDTTVNTSYGQVILQLLVIIVLIPLSVWYLFTHRKHLGEMKGKVDMKDWTITVSMNHFSLPLHSSVDTWKILHASPSPHANLLFCLLHFSTLECFKSFFPNTSVFCDFCPKKDYLDDFWTLVTFVCFSGLIPLDLI